MIARVLAVEDHRNEADDMKWFVQSIPAKDRAPRGIEEFEIELAWWVNMARAKLKEALVNNKPFDIMLVNLSLPKGKGESAEVQNGLDLLQEAVRLQAVREIIAVSGFKVYKNVSEAYHGGVKDFVGKGFGNTPDLLKSAVLRSWDRILVTRSAQVLDAESWNLCRTRPGDRLTDSVPASQGWSRRWCTPGKGCVPIWRSAWGSTLAATKKTRWSASLAIWRRPSGRPERNGRNWQELSKARRKRDGR